MTSKLVGKLAAVLSGREYAYRRVEQTDARKLSFLDKRLEELNRIDL